MQLLKQLIRLNSNNSRCICNLVSSLTRNQSTTTTSTGTMEKKNSHSSFNVCVEGNIGSGKTTLLNYLSGLKNEKRGKKISVWCEPVDRWRNVRGHNLFSLMYSDPNRWSLAFQTYVQLTMAQLHQLMMKPIDTTNDGVVNGVNGVDKEINTKDVRLMERSIFSARYCFVENLYKSEKMSEVEYLVLDEWFKWLTRNGEGGHDESKVKVDLIVYLRAKPETVLQRMKERCRKEEVGVSLDYLRKLHDLHERWLLREEFPLPAPVLVINADLNREEMITEFKKYTPIILGESSMNVITPQNGERIATVITNGNHQVLNEDRDSSDNQKTSAAYQFP